MANKIYLDDRVEVRYKVCKDWENNSTDWDNSGKWELREVYYTGTVLDIKRIYGGSTAPVPRSILVLRDYTENSTEWIDDTYVYPLSRKQIYTPEDKKPLSVFEEYLKRIYDEF